jgi:hypothetical protein
MVILNGTVTTLGVTELEFWGSKTNKIIYIQGQTPYTIT